ncbi:transposase [Desulfosediminicola sp.]|uniref:transposase n=1 Tax=Desulfosediminicola sp. TaxID=2886825 RepID=UPI003AF2FD63
MSRLLTGHAIYFNRRHRRHGHLFQNRYKSILCQEDTYLLELVRYIHLSPLRSKLVKDMDQLVQYPFSGHAIIMGSYEQPWQDNQTVLTYFGNHLKKARSARRTFAAKVADQGRRDELIGGWLIRSSVGCAGV